MTPAQEQAQRAFAEVARELTLPELVQRFRELLDASYGEVTPEIEQQLDALAHTTESKVAAYCAVYRSLEKEAEANDALSEYYQARAQSIAKQREQLKQRLSEALRTMGVSKVKTPTATVYFQRASKAKLVVKDDQAAMSAGYWKDRRMLDTEKLRADLERGEPCAFAELVTDESLRIR